MNYAEFTKLLPEDAEIGRVTTDYELAVYREHNESVGVWRVDRRTTVGHGEILGEWAAACAVSYFNQVPSRSW